MSERIGINMGKMTWVIIREMIGITRRGQRLAQ